MWRVRDGGVVPRARLAPGRRDPVRRRHLHQPDTRPPRLPYGHGGLLRGEAPAIRDVA
jgi:hypothetical protein